MATERGGATPVAREPASVLELAPPCNVACDAWPTGSTSPHAQTCPRGRFLALLASAEEVERVLVEALKPFAVAEAEPNRCGCCHWLLEKCIDENCRGFHARRALARVASLRGGAK